MTVTVAQLQNYVGTKETGDFIESCITNATSMVTRYIGTSPCPSTIKDEAVLITASELFHARSAPQGIAGFASQDGSPVRTPRDVMTRVYPILQPYVGYAV